MGSEEDVRPTRKEAKVVNRRNARSAAPGLRTGRRLVLLGALTSVLVLGPAALAAADPPIRQEFTVELSGPHFLSGFCGFTILQEGTAHFSTTTFDDGRVIEHIDVDLELTANGNVALEKPLVHRGGRPRGWDRDPHGNPREHPRSWRGTALDGGGPHRSGPGHGRPPLLGWPIHDHGGGPRQGLLVLRGRSVTSDQAGGGMRGGPIAAHQGPPADRRDRGVRCRQSLTQAAATGSAS